MSAKNWIGRTTVPNRLNTTTGVMLLTLLVSLGSWLDAAAQICPGTTVSSDLTRPMGLALSNQRNLIVSETGTAALHSGRISILDPDGLVSPGTPEPRIEPLPHPVEDLS